MATAKTRSKAKTIRRKLLYENLEQCLMLSGDPVASLSRAGLLPALGTDVADQLVIQQSGTSADGGVIIDLSVGSLVGRCGTAEQGIPGMELQGLAGADSFTLIEVTAPVTIDGGEGDDTVLGADVDNNWALIGAGTLRVCMLRRTPASARDSAALPDTRSVQQQPALAAKSAAPSSLRASQRHRAMPRSPCQPWLLHGPQPAASRLRATSAPAAPHNKNA